MEIDLSIHNKQETTFSLGNFKFFILRDNPMKSAFEYAHGLDGLFDGLVIEIKENSVRNTNKVSKSDPARLHAINGYLRDEQYNLINDPQLASCAMQFTDQTLYLHVKNGKVKLAFKDKSTGRENSKSCLEIKLPEHYFSEDHDIYMFLSADSGS